MIANANAASSTGPLVKAPRSPRVRLPATPARPEPSAPGASQLRLAIATPTPDEADADQASRHTDTKSRAIRTAARSPSGNRIPALAQDIRIAQHADRTARSAHPAGRPAGRLRADLLGRPRGQEYLRRRSVTVVASVRPPARGVAEPVTAVIGSCRYT